MKTLTVGIISASWESFERLPGWSAIPGFEAAGICTARRDTGHSAAARSDFMRPHADATAMPAAAGVDGCVYAARDGRHRQAINMPGAAR